MPGSSPTMARREPTMRLNSVDFPTLGRPTMAMVGTPAVTGALIELELIRVKVYRDRTRVSDPCRLSCLGLRRSKLRLYSGITVETLLATSLPYAGCGLL